MEIFEQAQDLDRRYLAQALEEQQRNKPQGESRTHCLNCKEKIPEARRQAAMGCEYCVTCGEKFGPQRRR